MAERNCLDLTADFYTAKTIIFKYSINRKYAYRLQNISNFVM